MPELLSVIASQLPTISLHLFRNSTILYRPLQYLHIFTYLHTLFFFFIFKMVSSITFLGLLAPLWSLMSATTMAQCSDSVVAVIEDYTDGNCQNQFATTRATPDQVGPDKCNPLPPNTLSVRIACVGQNPDSTAARYDGKL